MLECADDARVPGGLDMIKILLGEHMRYVSVLSVLLVVLCITGKAQVVRLSSDGCSVAPSGIESCYAVGYVLQPPDTSSFISVTQYVLAPHAPLILDLAQDTIIVVADEGALLDETQVPRHLNVPKGASFFVPKGKKTSLRNAGAKELTVVEIVIRKPS